MVRIRLKRLGRKHKPFYRIVVTDIRNRREGAPLVEIGYYNPMTKQLKMDKAAALDWISKGAQPSERAQWLIERADETGAEVTLQIVKKERLSKKAQEKAKKAETVAESA